MRAILAACLCQESGAPVEVLACNVDYFRQSPGRFVVQYTVQLREPETDEPRDQVISAISFGAAQTQAVWSTLSSPPPAPVANGRLLLRPVAYVSELELLVQVFPYDRRLPSLVSVLHGSPELATPLLAELGPGEWRACAWRNEVVRYRPDQRAMVRLELSARESATGRTALCRVYAKVYADAEAGQRGFHLLRALWRQTTSADVGFAVARPIAYLDGPQTLLQSELPGVRLLDVLRHAETAEATKAVRRAARAVAGLHQLDVPRGLLRTVRRDRGDRAAGAAAALSQRFPAYAAAIDEVAAAVAAGIAAAPLAPTHFDLKPGNILDDGQHVSLLDFDKLAFGDPMIDVANMVANLGTDQEGGRRRSQRKTVPGRVFLDEYFAHVPAAWRAFLPARYALATLVEADTGRGARGRPARTDRDARIAAAVARAREILAGHVW
jgi:aminoglycoside phosphotransferase (APT) family kinase protein